MSPITLFALILLAGAPRSDGQDTAGVLAKMDEAASSFRSMSGKIKKVTHTAVIDDTSEETGTISLKKNGTRDIRMLVDISQPDVKSYALRERKAEIYFPKLKTVQEYDLSKQAKLVDQFLLLGFGTPVKELRQTYDVKLDGEEMTAGQKTARVTLIPKSSAVREHLTKAELWVSLADGHTLQQKFYEPSGDYRLVEYSDTRWNPNLTDTDVALKLPGGVKREYPQK